MSNRRVYTRMIVSYLAIFLLPLVINIFILHDIAEDTQTNICESVRVNLKHVQESVDDDFREINNIITNLTANNNIRYLATQMTVDSKNIEFSKIKQAQEYIAALQVQTLVEEYYVYFHKPQMIFTPKNVFLNEEQSGFFFSYDGIATEEWLEMMKENYSQHFFPESQTMQNVKTQEMFLYVQSLLTVTGNQGTFVFPIRSEAVKSLIRDYYIPQAGWAYVLDKEGRQILSIPSEKGEFLTVDPALTAEESGISEITMEGRRMALISVDSQYIGLKYVAVIPKEYIAEEISHAQQKLFLLTAAIFITGLLGIGAVSWYKGRKITGIMQLFFSIRPEGEEFRVREDAMEYISKSVKELIEKNTDLREDIKRQEPVTRSLLLERLMMGTMSGARMKQSLENFGITLDGSQLLVFLFSLHEPNDSDMELEADESTIYMQLLNNDLESLFPEQKYICSIDVDSLAMILVLDRKYETVKMEGLEKLTEMYRIYRADYGVNLRIAVSAVCSDWKDIGKAYDQACEIMEYRAGTEKEILFYDEYQDKKEYYYFPVTLEERLINAVKTGNTESTREQLRQVYTMNVLERDLSPAMMHLLINDLQCTIYKILHSLGPHVEIGGEGMRGRLEALSSEKDLLNRFQHINQIFLLLSEKVAETNREDKNQIVQGIAEYVEKNYQDKDMSLTKIAETFGYANTYFSRLFKELFGMNFTSYLEKVRIEHACELLKMDMTLEKIAELTGYNSGYVLRTAFKRMKGMTPNDYRKSQREG